MSKSKTARLAIIPARGGSKRIPYKNISLFEGKPMIIHTIEAAYKSDCFDRVLVSTDDEKIARVSRDAGAEVPFLRTHKTDDFEPVSVSVYESLIQAEEFYGKEWHSVVMLMANCPLRGEGEIQRMVKIFEEEERTRQISVFRYGFMNPFWACQRDDEGHGQSVF